MDLQGDLRHFWPYLRFVPGFLLGPAALSEDIAPGPEDRDGGYMEKSPATLRLPDLLPLGDLNPGPPD